jgi:ABC-type glycerol-3-phosphate transport system substrate-binding protein
MRALIALVAVALLVAAGAVAVDASVEEGSKEVTVNAESFTPNTTTYVELNESNRDKANYFKKRNIVVRDGNGDRVDRTDFQWNSTNGTIKAVPGGALDGATNAEIDYGYYPITPLSENLGGTYGYVLNASTVLVMVLAVAIVLGSVKVLVS